MFLLAFIRICGGFLFLSKNGSFHFQYHHPHVLSRVFYHVQPRDTRWHDPAVVWSDFENHKHMHDGALLVDHQIICKTCIAISKYIFSHWRIIKTNVDSDSDTHEEKKHKFKQHWSEVTKNKYANKPKADDRVKKVAFSFFLFAWQNLILMTGFPGNALFSHFLLVFRFCLERFIRRAFQAHNSVSFSPFVCYSSKNFFR